MTKPKKFFDDRMQKAEEAEKAAQSAAQENPEPKVFENEELESEAVSSVYYIYYKDFGLQKTDFSISYLQDGSSCPSFDTAEMLDACSVVGFKFVKKVA